MDRKSKLSELEGTWESLRHKAGEARELTCTGNL